MTIKIHMNSLGCAKNLVNSEQMLALLRREGMEIVEDLRKADVAIVNTCGFIDEAKQEAINIILEEARLKEEGQLKALIATGCLVERYKEEILQEMPEVDAICGTGSYTDIVLAVKGALAGRRQAYLGQSAQAALKRPAASHKALFCFSAHCRRVQQPLQLLHHSRFAGTLPQPSHGEYPGGGLGLGGKRSQRAAGYRPGHHPLWHRSLWQADAARASGRSSARSPGWNGCACITLIPMSWTMNCWM